MHTLQLAGLDSSWRFSPQEPAYNPAFTPIPLQSWVHVEFGKAGVVWLCGDAGAFPELGGAGAGTCASLYQSFEYLLTTTYASATFFDDAVVTWVTCMQANPGLVSYCNQLEASAGHCCAVLQPAPAAGCPAASALYCKQPQWLAAGQHGGGSGGAHAAGAIPTRGLARPQLPVRAQRSCPA